MNKPTREQIKEFREKLGVKSSKVYEQGLGYIMAYPPTDLNNLFKYAVPKILLKYDIKIFSFYDDLNDKVFWFVHIIGRETGEVEFANIEGYEELKDALFWVVGEARGRNRGTNRPS